jgi:signal transduction histidine kinase
MGISFKMEKIHSLFWRIYLLVVLTAPAFFAMGFFQPYRPYRQDPLGIYLFAGIYALFLLFIFLYLQSVFSKENIDKMAELSSIADDIQAEKLASLETLTAGIAHEINNPLGIILGFSSLMLEKTDPESQIHKDLTIIERQGLQCKKVVENLMNFTRGKGSSEGNVNLNSVIENLMAVVGPGLRSQRISWECLLEPKLPLGPGNIQRWQQVLLNLINNAKAAMPKGGKIKIWTRWEENLETIELGFLDTGSGIPKEDLAQVFDPFFSTKKGGKGIGLGLSIIYGIIKTFDGTIACQSRTDADSKELHGTTFIMSVPLIKTGRTPD